MSDSRTARNELKEFFGGPLSTWASNFSAEASLVSPGAGNHLRVFQVTLTAPGANSTELGVEIRDGANMRALLYVPAGGVRYLKFDGRYLEINTALRITHAGTVEDLAVFVGYKEVENV
jgi:hypothetical protein